MRASAAMSTLPDDMAENPLSSSDPVTIGIAAPPGEKPRGLFGFWCLIATQFQGAFSDNVLKWLFSFLIIGIGLSKDDRDLISVLVIPLLFSVPFLLFSMTGGYLADRFSKRTVTIATKVMEMSIMGLALAGLVLGNFYVIGAALFLVSTQAALFGPSKYGLLPELVPEKELSWCNGVLELGTFIAVITGTLAGGMLAKWFYGKQEWSGVTLVALAGVGLLSSLGITRVPAAAPARKFRANTLGDLVAQIRYMRRDRVLWLAVLGNMYFWFLGSLLLLNIVLYSADILRADEAHTSYLLATLSLGIGAGSFAAGYLSGKKIEYGLLPLGSIGMTALSASLARPHLSYLSVAVQLGALGFFGGFYAVPINALIQHRPESDRKGGVIAAANLLSFVGIAAQPIVQYLMIQMGHPDPPRIFLYAAGLTLAATARSSSRITCLSWTPACSSLPPTGPFASSCSRASTIIRSSSPLRRFSASSPSLPSCARARCCVRSARPPKPSRPAKWFAFSPKDKSRVSVTCFPFAAVLSAS